MKMRLNSGWLARMLFCTATTASSTCVAVLLVSRTKALLVGEGVSDDTLAELQTLARGIPGVTTVRPPLTMYLAPDDVMLALDVDFDDHLTATQVEEAVVAVQNSIRAGHPEFKRIFIEAKSLAGRA